MSTTIIPVHAPMVDSYGKLTPEWERFFTLVLAPAVDASEPFQPTDISAIVLNSGSTAKDIDAVQQLLFANLHAQTADLLRRVSEVESDMFLGQIPIDTGDIDEKLEFYMQAVA